MPFLARKIACETGLNLRVVHTDQCTKDEEEESDVGESNTRVPIVLPVEYNSNGDSYSETNASPRYNSESNSNSNDNQQQVSDDDSTVNEENELVEECQPKQYDLMKEELLLKSKLYYYYTNVLLSHCLLFCLYYMRKLCLNAKPD